MDRGGGGHVSLRVENITWIDNKSENCGFETRLGKWTFSVYLILPAALYPGVYSASNRNEYQ
jgi:hypothetical protein